MGKLQELAEEEGAFAVDANTLKLLLDGDKDQLMGLMEHMTAGEVCMRMCASGRGGVGAHATDMLGSS
jgi:hypothetical protein